MARQKKPKKDRSAQKYTIIDPKTEEGAHVAELLKMVLAYPEHAELAEQKVKVLAAWMLGLKPNRDGQVVLGKLHRCTELERIQTGVNLVVKLNQGAWREMDDRQRLAVLDDKLCRVNVVPGPDGVGAARDGHDFVRLRERKPDIVEFRSVLARHGSYQADIRKCVDAALAGDQQLALPDGELDRKLRIAK